MPTLPGKEPPSVASQLFAPMAVSERKDYLVKKATTSIFFFLASVCCSLLFCHCLNAGVMQSVHVFWVHNSRRWQMENSY